jgi:hypothetical protein
VELADRAPVDCEPLAALAPDHEPDAVQAVAFVEAHVKVAPLPLFTVLGLALKTTVGVDAATATTVVCDALPPLPVQVSVKLSFDFSAPVDCDPLTAFAPDQPPEAVHAVALVDVQLRVELAPLFTLVGEAPRAMVGGDPVTETVTDCDALPPAPLQLKV